MSGLLLRMAMVISLVSGALTAVLPSWAEEVGVRAARTNDYGRIVFDWKKTVSHDLKLDKRSLTVRFGRPIEASYEKVLRVLRKYVADARPGDDGRSVIFGLQGNFDAYSFDSGRTVIVEIADTLLEKAPLEKKDEQADGSVKKVRQQVAEQEVANGNLPRIRVRSGVHENYSRMVFDWRDSVGYNLVKDDGLVIITFRRAADLQVAKINKSPPPYVGGIRSRPGDGVTKLMLTVPKTSSIKHFLIGSKVVVDIFRPTGSKEISALPAKEITPEGSVRNASRQTTASQKQSDNSKPQRLLAKGLAKAPVNSEKPALAKTVLSEETKQSNFSTDKNTEKNAGANDKAKATALTPPVASTKESGEKGSETEGKNA